MGGDLFLGILKESAPGETRVAFLPESLKSLIAQGIAVTVKRARACRQARPTRPIVDAGATVTADRASILAGADLILPVVTAPDAADQAQLKPGAVVIGFLRPLDAPACAANRDRTAVTLFSMELVPRISRAQSMDALSSMATVAGYKAGDFRRRSPATHVSDADDGRGHSAAGTRIRDRGRSRGTAGDCNRAPTWRGGGGL